MLEAGTSLGPYKILAPLGAGGMGEVYRARDTRLGRDVAVKVITAALVGDPESIKRFAQEAHAAGSLNHANVCTIYDVGRHENLPYVVMELLDGESLRRRLQRGPIPARKAIAYAVQAAHGLAAAHEKGIVHRDLKPENLFLTLDERVKILDFGLAKLTRPGMRSPADDEPISIAATRTGTILGTIGYMAPEQVQGEPADHRTDLFALGAILYEMVCGRRAFPGLSFVETAYRILNEEPQPLDVGEEAPPAIEGILRRCLEKSPRRRFQSAADLAFALEVAGGANTMAVTVVSTPAPQPAHRSRWRFALAPLVALALIGASLVSWHLGGRSARSPVPLLERVTFRRGAVMSARFAPDGRTVVYSARWDGREPELYVQRLGTPDARSLGPGAHVVGTTGNDVLILHGAPRTLARLPLEGGMPRDVMRDVVAADWRGDANALVLRQVDDHQELECPVGTVLLKTTGFGMIRSPRLSPRGDRIAFIDNPGGDVAYFGDVACLDRTGRKQVLSRGWDDAGGLAWSADGQEIWFTAARGGVRRALYAVTMDGEERLIMRLACSLVLHDIAPDGRVLLSHGQARIEIRGRMAGDAVERDLSWLDGSFIPRLSADGSQMVFEEWGEGGGLLAASYLRRADGSPVVRLGDGEPLDVSRDWTRVVARTGFRYPDNQLRIIPIGAGEIRALPRGAIRDFMWAWWYPDGRRLLIAGNEAGAPVRMFVQDLPDGVPRPLQEVAGTATFNRPFSPEGRSILSRLDAQSAWTLYPLDGGTPRPVRGLLPDDEPCGWSADGRQLFVVAGGKRFPVQLVRFDLETGRRDPWVELTPPDLAGVAGLYGADVPLEGTTYAYCYERVLSDLYLVWGLGERGAGK